MNNIKIIVTAPPRSGHAWFTYMLKRTLVKDPSQDYDSIKRNNMPLMLYGTFENIIQTTILRKPDQTIPSTITKIYGGLGKNYVLGVNMPTEIDSVFTMNGLVDEESRQYLEWTKAINKNINKIVPFTFEQITLDIKNVCNYFIKYYKINDINPLTFDISKIMNEADINIHRHQKTAKEYNNALPVIKKPDVYNEAKLALQSNGWYSKLNDEYAKTLENIKNRQLDLGYN
jgi:hypothetical protein